MRFGCGGIPIGFKQSDLFRMLFERNGVQRQDARFNTNRSLDFFFKGGFVGAVILRRDSSTFSTKNSYSALRARFV